MKWIVGDRPSLPSHRLLEGAGGIMGYAEEHELRIPHRIVRRESQAVLGASHRFLALTEVGECCARQRPGERMVGTSRERIVKALERRLAVAPEDGVHVAECGQRKCI